MKKINILLSAAALISSIISCQKADPEFPEFNGAVETVNEVDLGLSVKWCSHNIGANLPEEVGTYYAWGESSEKSDYTLDTYSLYDKDTSAYTTTPGGTWADDVATKTLGTDWSIPTPEQLAELADTEKCTAKKASFHGVKGWIVTSKVKGYEGKSLFFPVSGYKASTHINNADTQASVWGNRTEATDSTHAANLFFEYDKALVNTAPKGVGGTLWCGYPIRPVKKK